MILTDIFFQLVILPLGSGIISIVLERRFKIAQHLKKLIAWVFNSPVKLKVIFTLESSNSSKEIGKKISDIWKKQGFITTVIKDSENYYGITNGTYNIDLGRTEEGIILQTSTLDTVMRSISERFSEIMKIIEKIDAKMEEVSLSVSLPYTFEFVEIKPVSSLSVIDYNVKLGDDRWKSQLSLKLKNKRQQIDINGKSESEVHEIINNLFRAL